MLGYPNDRFHHIWEAAATATALLKPMIYLGRHDEVPGIGFQKLDNGLFDILFGDQVAVTDNHVELCWVPARNAGLDIGKAYWKTLSGASRLSDPSKAMESSFNTATTRSIDLVWSISPSIAA
jgi:hypothetical protein